MPALCDHVGHEYGVEVLSGQPIVQPSFAPFAVVEKSPESSLRTAAAPCLCRTTFEDLPVLDPLAQHLEARARDRPVAGPGR